MNKIAADLWIGMRTGPARSALALASLTVGFFAVAILLATLDALRRQARDLVQSFGAETFVLARSDKAAEPGWNRRHVEFLRANLGAGALVSGLKILPAPAGSKGVAVAADAELARARGWRFVAGRALDETDMRQGARVAMASVDLCRRNRWEVGTLIVLDQEPYRLVGCHESTGLPLAVLPENAVCIPHTADTLEAREAYDLQRVEAILFRAVGDAAPEDLRRRVAALMSQPGFGSDGIEWITPQSLLQGIRRWQRAIAWTAGSAGGLGLLLGGVTLAGLLLTGVRERIPEIGLRRALGARRWDVAGLFVTEALVLTGLSALAGMAAAEATLRWLGERFPLPFHFGLGARLLPFAVGGVVGVLCAIGPAWRAARLPPAEALRND